jgi:molecular chaperone DnaK (HSP70)
MAGTLAIDLGSTTTVVAWQEEHGEPGLLSVPPYSMGTPCVVPSLLWLSHPEQSDPLLGRQVVEAGLADASSPGLCRDFKRWIGAASSWSGAADQDGPAASWLSAEQAGALLLRRLWQALPASLEPKRLVLTAPVDAFSGYRRWLTDMAEELAVPEIALVDEPTAAAIGCGLSPGSKVLVVDFGGGTLDVSLVVLEGGEGRAAPMAHLLRFAGRTLRQSGQKQRTASVLGKIGLPLGGRDLDRWIAAALCPGHSPSPEILGAAEVLKRQLSDRDDAFQIHTPAAGPPLELRLSRLGLERLLEERGVPQVLEEALAAMGSAARRAGFELNQLDAVLPVGGGSRIPWFRRFLSERLPGVPLRDERPVEAVAMGALALTPGVRLQDVLSRGVSLRVWDQRSRCHRWHPLFLPGQPWPTSQPLELVLACGATPQSSLELVLGEPLLEERTEVVFEGGLPVIRSRAAGAPSVRPWSQPPVTLSLSPPGATGTDRLRLRFSINSHGELRVEGEDLLLGAPLPAQVLGPVR